MKSVYNTVFYCYMAALLLAFSLSPAPAYSEEDNGPSSGLGYARVSYMEGDVLFYSPDTSEWAALSLNFPLRDGDRVWAGNDSRVEIRFDGGETAWVSYESELDLVKVHRGAEGDTYQLALPSGEASFGVGDFSTPDSVFQVDTPGSSIMAYGMARFRVSVASDGTMQVGVKGGSVEVETDSGVDNVNADTMYEADADGYVRYMILPDNDGWDGWVAERSDRYDRPYTSARYLPDDMKGYADEFEDSGRWERSPGYGNVWVPDVASDWSPYSNGRWVWVAGDYVWLPFDPWYAPFHFGRWRWTASTGWCWVPPHRGRAYWSPGYVGWSWGANTLYWVPLAPGEIYYGYGDYGPLSVNVRRHHGFDVTNPYENSRVRHGVVGVDRDDFLKGRNRRIELNGAANPFRHGGGDRTRLIARPPVEELKPIAETRLPRPEVKLPDRGIVPRDLANPAPFIHERAVARHKGESTFKFKPPPQPRRPDQEAPQKQDVSRPFQRRIGQEKPGGEGEQVKERGKTPAGGQVQGQPPQQPKEQVIEQPKPNRERAPFGGREKGLGRAPAGRQVQEQPPQQAVPQQGVPQQVVPQQVVPVKPVPKVKKRLPWQKTPEGEKVMPEGQKAPEETRGVVRPGEAK